jgi:predicted ATP-dependent serine protease
MRLRCGVCSHETSDVPAPILCNGCGRAETYFPARAPGDPTPDAAPVLSLADDAPPVRRVATGIADVDRLLEGGPALSATVLVHGREGSGKSSLTLRVAAGCSATLDCPTLVVCPEMSHAILSETARKTGAQLSRLFRCKDPASWESEASAVGARVLLVDSVSKMPDPLGTLGRVIDWARRCNAVALCLAHQTTRGTARGGGGAVHDPDTVLQMTHDRRTGERRLVVEKSRTCALGFAVITPPTRAPRKRKPPAQRTPGARQARARA